MRAHQNSSSQVLNRKGPTNFHIQLGSLPFNRSFLHFLAEEWKKSICSKLIKDQTLYVGLEDQAWLYKVSGDIVVKEEVPDLVCNHQEAGTRLIWHLKHISETQPDSNACIRSDDTDILVILLTHVSSFAVKVCLDVGHNNQNSRWYIDVTSLASILDLTFAMYCLDSRLSLAVIIQLPSSGNIKSDLLPLWRRNL